MRRWMNWGAALGFALGGFFDGILLHQILQWHHLLSLVPGTTSLRTQILWDGYFHALMYILAAAGLAGLWRAHGSTPPTPKRNLAGPLLVGFGLWHVVDAVLSHWILGIHRLKIDSPNPLTWDLLWLGAFGIVPLLGGFALLRRPRRGTETHAQRFTLLLIVGLATVSAGIWSSQAPAGPQRTTVVFAPGVRTATVLDAVADADARIAWSNHELSVVVVDVPRSRSWAFYRRGALLVSGSGVPGGCSAWSQI